MKKGDIKTAFLYEELEEDVFMLPPEGYEYGNKVCKLKKALYSLHFMKASSTEMESKIR